MWTKIGTYVLNFLLEKIWGVLYKAILVGVDYFTELLIKIRRKKILEKNEEKLSEALKSGDKDAIAKQGQNSLNGSE